MPQSKSVFRARRHNSVRLLSALCHKVVYHNSDIRFVAPQNEGRSAQYLIRRIYSRNKSLRGGFLVTRSSVYLSSGVKSAYFFVFQSGIHVQRIYAVVFYRVSVAHYIAVFKPRNGTVHLLLRFVRHGGGHSLHVNFVCVQALGFEKNLMSVLVFEPDNLCFYRGAVSRTRGGNVAVVQRRTV